MADTPFAALWADAKAAFTKASNRKKPSEKFLSVFRKSSGLEKATADLDKAIDKASLDNLKALSGALDKFTAAKNNYMTTLTAAQNREEEPAAYKKACVDLRKALEAMTPEFIERRIKSLQDSLSVRLVEMSQQIKVDRNAIFSFNVDQTGAIAEAQKRLKDGDLLAPKVLEGIEKAQATMGKKLLTYETKILPEIEKYYAFFNVKRLQDIPTSSKPQAIALDAMRFNIERFKKNSIALESLIKDSEKAAKKYNAEALSPLRKAVADFNDVRREAYEIAVLWTDTRGKDLITEKEASKINAHLAATFKELDRATGSLCSEIKKADRVLEKNKAQLGEMAEVVASVHKYDGKLDRLQKKVADALKIKLTKKSTEDDVCKLGSPLSTVLEAAAGLGA